MVKKICVFVGLFLVFLVFSKETYAVSCDPACTGNQHCIQTGPLAGTCQSEGPGQTTPRCTIRFTSQAVVGKQLFIEVDAGDNGETFFQQPSPTVSSGCGQLLGFCGSGNMCANRESQGVCTNVCSRMYTYPKNAGSCTVSATVFNGAGSSSCSESISVACPAKIVLSGEFSGNPKDTCVDVYSISGTRKTIGTYCGGASWRVINIDSGIEYEIIPQNISGYKVSPTSVKTGKTCGSKTVNFKYTKIPVTPPPVPPVVPPPPPEVGSFFQTFNGNVTALGDLSNENLDSGAISKGKLAKIEAGVIAGNPPNLPAGALFSENGAGNGFNLNLSKYESKEAVPSYDFLLRIFLRNIGFKDVASIPSCPDGNFDWPPFHIWCYSSDLNGKIVSAIERQKNMPDPDIKFFVFIPSSNLTSGSQRLTSNFTGSDSINATMLAFVPGGDTKAFKVLKDLQVKDDQKSALMAIIDGGMLVDSSVNRADGFYVFSGPFNDGVSDEKLVGNGSLIGTGEEAFSSPNGLMRTFLPQAAESWTFDGKYLTLYQNLLSRPKFYWKQLPAN